VVREFTFEQWRYQRMNTLSMLNNDRKKNNSNDEIDKYLHKTGNIYYLDK